MADPVPPAIGRPPWPVIVAIVCVIALLFDAALQMYGRVRLFGPSGGISAYLSITTAWCVLLPLTAWFLARRRGWARWVLVAAAVDRLFRGISVFMSVKRTNSDPMRLFDLDVGMIVFWLPTLFVVLALIMVFGPGRAWFRS